MERSSPPVTGHFSPRELLLGRGQGLTPPLDSPERRRRSAAVTMTVSRHDSLRRPEDTPIRRSCSGQHGFSDSLRSRAMDPDTLAQVHTCTRFLAPCLLMSYLTLHGNAHEGPSMMAPTCHTPPDGVSCVYINANSPPPTPQKNPL